MNVNDDTRSQLSKLLKGATIVSIGPPDTGKQECLFKAVAQRGKHIMEFHLHATDLGCWLSGVKQGSGEILLQSDLLGVFDEMIEHLSSPTLDAEEPQDSFFEAIDDVMTRSFGFRCKKTGKEWRFSLGAVKASPWAKSFLSPESRQALADYVSQHFSLPPRSE